MKYKISQSIKLASQRRTRDRNGKDNNNSYESKRTSWLFEVKRRNEKFYVLIRKRDFKGGKQIAPIDFAEFLRKSDVSKNGGVYYGQFLRNGLHE